MLYCVHADVGAQFLMTSQEHGMSMWAVPFAKDNRAPLFPNMGDGNTTYHRAQRQAIERYGTTSRQSYLHSRTLTRCATAPSKLVAS